MKLISLVFISFFAVLQSTAAGYTTSKGLTPFQKAQDAVSDAQNYLATAGVNYTMKGFETYMGRKLTMWERKAFKQLRKVDLSPEDEAAMLKNKRLATWSMVMGIAGFGIMFIPYLGALSLLLFPAALITGIIASSHASQFKNRQGSGYGRAIAGIVTGSIGIAFILVVIAAFIAWY